MIGVELLAGALIFALAYFAIASVAACYSLLAEWVRTR